jgi:uncharacterized membrane protein
MICSYCSASMPEVSAFCPGCGRAVESHSEAESGIAGVAALSRDAILGGIAYFTVLPAIALLLVPATRKVEFVRFHSWQSVLFSVSTVVLAGAARLLFVIFSVVPMFGFLLAWLVAGVVSLALAFLWIAIVIKAALGDSYELPLIGEWAIALAKN